MGVIEQHIPCETVVGNIAGRDAIFLDDVSYTGGVLILRGDITSSLCSHFEGDAKWISYKLTFWRVIAVQIVEIDLSDWEGRPSFIEIHGSSWLTQFRQKDTTDRMSLQHKHFRVMTYDDVFDIIATSFQLDIQPARDSFNEKIRHAGQDEKS